MTRAIKGVQVQETMQVVVMQEIMLVGMGVKQVAFRIALVVMEPMALQVI
jgi:hypothetical protein